MKKYFSGKGYLHGRVIMLFITFFSLLESTYAQITADFTVEKPEGCVPLIVNFENITDADTSNVSVIWNFGNGNQSREKKYTQAVFNVPGVYDVTLLVDSSGVVSTRTQQVTVYDNPQANFYADIRSGCIPLEVRFTDSTIPTQNPIVNWTWNFGDGTGSELSNPENVFISESNYNITLIVTDSKGCKKSIVKDDYIITTHQPVINFSYTDTVTCKLPLNIRYTENVQSSYPFSLSWDFGNQRTSTSSRPTTIYTEDKTYPVKLSVVNNYGCRNEITKNVTIKEEAFNAGIISNSNFGCAPFVYRYSASSNFQISQYEWQAGTFTSASSSGVFVFTQTGQYIVRLKATDAQGCSVEVFDTIQIAQKPVADFATDKTEACIGPLEVNFQTLTPDAIAHRWTFNQNVTASNDANPTKILTKDGAYNVQYIATNAAGCSDTIIKQSLINIARPDVNIISSKEFGCIPYVSDLSILKTGVGEIKDIHWIFPDGTQYNGETPPDIQVYTEGVYAITAEVRFEGNCPLQTKTKTIIGGELAPFSASFSPKLVCVKEGVGGSVLNPAPDTRYTWHFGDGGTKEGANVAYEYSDIGDFNVSIVAEKSGCIDSIPVEDISVVVPMANFTVTKLCSNGEYRFNNRSIGNTITKWDFGDGSILTSNAANVTHTFADTGTYQVKLYVENSGTLCKDSLTIEVVNNNINNNIVLQPKYGCLPYTASFNISSLEYSSIRWRIGDTTISGRNLNYRINQPGVYDISVQATRINGCIESYSFPGIVTVTDVVADFDFDPIGGCAPIEVNFKDKTISQYSQIVNWEWIVNGQANTAGPNTKYLFSTNHDADIRLITTDNIGCKDTINKTVPIYIPKADFRTEFSSVCTGANFSFESLSTGVGLTYLWTFSNGVGPSLEQHPVKIFEKEGHYDVKLVVVDANNCKDSIMSEEYVVVENYQYDFSGYPRFKTCPELITKFEVFPSNIFYKSAHWDFGNGNQSLDTNRTPVNIYAESGVFDVRLVLEDFRGCKDTIVKEDFIEVKGPRGKVNFTPTNGCLPLNVEFKAEFIDSKYNFWDFGTGIGKLDATLQDTMSFVYTDPGRAIPVLILDDGLGCVVQLHHDTLIISGANVKIDVSQNSICTGDELEFYDVTEDNEFAPVVTRMWEFSNGNTSTGESSLQILNVDSTDILYAYLTVKTAFGCEDSDSIGIKVFSFPEITIPEQLIVCKGDNIKLEATGANNYSWEPKKFITDMHSGSPVVSPLEDTWFKLVAHDTSLCTTRDSVFVKVVTSFDAYAGPDTILCTGDNIQLFTEVSDIHSGVFEYTWKRNSEVVSNEKYPEFIADEDAAYIVNIRNGSCREYTIPVYVNVSSIPELTVFRDTTIAHGQSITLSAGSDQEVTYRWTPEKYISCNDCFNPTVRPVETTEYKVSVTNDFGCKNEAEVTVEIIDFCTEAKMEIPNIFSPNNDGRNDYFKVNFNKDLLQVRSMRIYNRYGELLFESGDSATGWDGTFNTVPVNTGVYVYYIEVDCYNGTSTMLKGNITLLR